MSNGKDRNAESAKRGPKEDRVKIEGDWRKAVGKALKKPRPPEGWPGPSEKPQE